MTRYGTTCLVALIGIFFALPGVAAATAPGVNGEIAFTSTRDGNRELYLMNSDGSQQIRLTSNPAEDDWAAWSSGLEAPNQKAWFTSDRDSNDEIYATAPFQSDSRNTVDPASDFQPAVDFKAGSFRIVWVHDGQGNNEIVGPPTFVEDQPTDLTDNPSSDTAPAWKPADDLIAFQSDRDGNAEIYRMTNTGASQTNLTNDPATDASPNWSPDGAKIAFESNRDGNFEIYVMNADGTNPTRLTNDPLGDRQPAWSPDGTKIAFQTNRDGNFEIYTMDANGSNPTRLTTDPGLDVNPDWRSLGSNPGYARPRGATPLRASLVPAMEPCTSPDRVHGPPLAFPSCRQPEPNSDFVTVGSPDWNGATANFVGSIKLSAKVGAPGPPEDSDVMIEVSMSDVRCRPPFSATCGSANAGAAGSDYTGSLWGQLPLRLSDRANSDGTITTYTGTVDDFVFPVPIFCVQTAATASVGSNCSVTTSANAIFDGVVKDGKRAIWQLDRVHILDGGSDGNGSTSPNEVFATQGVFVP